MQKINVNNRLNSLITTTQNESPIPLDKTISQLYSGSKIYDVELISYFDKKNKKQKIQQGNEVGVISINEPKVLSQNLPDLQSLLLDNAESVVTQPESDLASQISHKFTREQLEQIPNRQNRENKAENVDFDESKLSNSNLLNIPTILLNDVESEVNQLESGSVTPSINSNIQQEYSDEERYLDVLSHAQQIHHNPIPQQCDPILNYQGKKNNSEEVDVEEQKKSQSGLSKIPTTLLGDINPEIGQLKSGSVDLNINSNVEKNLVDSQWVMNEISQTQSVSHNSTREQFELLFNNQNMINKAVVKDINDPKILSSDLSKVNTELLGNMKPKEVTLEENKPVNVTKTMQQTISLTQLVALSSELTGSVNANNSTMSEISELEQKKKVKSLQNDINTNVQQIHHNALKEQSGEISKNKDINLNHLKTHIQSQPQDNLATNSTNLNHDDSIRNFTYRFERWGGAHNVQIHYGKEQVNQVQLKPSSDLVEFRLHEEHQTLPNNVTFLEKEDKQYNQQNRHHSQKQKEQMDNEEDNG